MKKLLLFSCGLAVGSAVFADAYPVAAPVAPAQALAEQGGAVELVQNGGFETDTVLVGRADYSYFHQGSTTANWSGTTEVVKDGGAGFQVENNNHPWCDSICNGKTIVYLQKAGAIWQTVTVPQGCSERFMQTPQIFRLHFQYTYIIIYACKRNPR